MDNIFKKYKIWFTCEDNEGSTDDYGIIIQFNNKEVDKFCLENQTVKNIQNQIVECYKKIHNIYDVGDVDDYCQFTEINDNPDIIIYRND